MDHKLLVIQKIIKNTIINLLKNSKVKISQEIQEDFMEIKINKMIILYTRMIIKNIIKREEHRN